MNVAILPSWYQNSRSDYAGIFVQDQAIAIQNEKINTTILFADLDIRNLSLNTLFNPKKISNRYENGINTYRIYGYSLPKWNDWTTRKWSIHYQKLFDAYINDNEKPDIIHAHSYFAGQVALDLKNKYGIPYIITEHHSGFVSGDIPKWQHPMIRKVLDNADAILAVSHDLKSRMQSFTKKEIEVIPNLVDTSLFQLASPKDEIIKIICVAGLYRRKCQLELIDAFDSISRRYVNIQLTLVGDGDLKNDIEKKVEKLKLTEKILLKGSQNRKNISFLLQSSHFFVLASESENLPVSIIEALCCGLPVLATDAGGVKELVNKDNGLLIATNNPQALELGLENMIKNHKKYQNSAIRKHTMEQFGSNIIAQKIIDVYHKIMRND